MMDAVCRPCELQCYTDPPPDDIRPWRCPCCARLHEPQIAAPQTTRETRPKGENAS